ncbi:BOI-related E3 ubiquitin-protein ligase 1-like [Arachis hypogaea]|uniref:RING-type domain-containing protein n=1 Tax=Arachis hypogaea TaxID=3818 RepID=A0A444WUH0_ARAHY|nr:E3 ubiquitin-protein ligase BOI-like [Arachis hypogaea]XP_025698436.1 E3 ubiquitin-protein ligase BOI-like [Arachis hypogaea]QHO40476.1 putative BOI-related E3 ubiquitin-protein ligase [Arachis hypogaea]RYQ81040.1 hypothetical protein Ahy_Scaffold1g107049 isoform A [Arachis hypogaea]
MAVQAQYPSNLLLLNTNNSNNNDDYSSALQPPHQLSRKRPRQPTPIPIPIPNNLMNQFNPPPPPPQQQQHQNQNVVSTGLRLSFSSQQRLQWQQTSSLLSQQLADQIKQQRHEIDQFLQAQGEQLRRSLADKRHNHFRALITAAEDTLARRLRDKETEVQKATRRNAELEARAAHLTAEAQLWQAKAKAQEATAASLQAQLHHAIMNAAYGGGAGPAGTADDAAAGVMSCAEDAESAYVDPERVAAAAGPRCRGCERRVATVVMLPCRHLCVCGECEMHFRACPVCLTVKNSTVEVFLS